MLYGCISFHIFLLNFVESKPKVAIINNKLIREDKVKFRAFTAGASRRWYDLMIRDWIWKYFHCNFQHCLYWASTNCNLHKDLEVIKVEDNLAMDGIENCFNSVTGYPATQPAMSADKWRSCWQLLIGFTIHTFGFTIDQAGVGTNINTFGTDDKEIYKLSFMPKICNNKTEW